MILTCEFFFNFLVADMFENFFGNRYPIPLKAPKNIEEFRKAIFAEGLRDLAQAFGKVTDCYDIAFCHIVTP